MKAKLLLRAFIGFVIWHMQGHLFGQGFVNLDFERANLPALPPGQYGGSVAASDALPGWQVFYGTSLTPVGNVLHNNYALGSINVSMLGPVFLDVPIIEGEFMPFLQSGFSGSPDPATQTASIAQSGSVPGDSQSLRFKVAGSGPPFFGVFLNGQSLAPVPLFATSGYTLYGVAVEQFAGQTANLRFTVGSRVNIGVDSFEFSPIAIPEPRACVLLGLGGALLLCNALRRRK